MMQLLNNRYHIQGVDLIQLAENFGSPLYVYDADKMVGQVQRLQNAFQGVKLRLKYAAKALTNISVLQLLRRAGAGIDVVSIEEAQMGLLAGYSPQDIQYTPNSVSFSEIQRAVELGVTINIDSISILEQFGHTYGGTVPCCIRVNPNILAGGNAKIQVGHADSKFGISTLQMGHVLKVVKSNGMRINGLHIHTGSDILESEAFLKGAQVLFELAEGFPDLEFIDFGGGFKVAYKEGDRTTDIEDLGAKMTAVFQDFCQKYGRELELWFEPGKFIVSEAGLLLVHTNVIKQTPTSTFAGIDSGLNHLIRPMLYDAYHDIVNLTNPDGPMHIYNVVGYICETDTFASNRKLNELRERDVLAIKNAGAYGFSMSSNYNSRLRPAEVLIYQGQAHLIRKRETFDDLLRNQIDIFAESNVLLAK